MAKKLKIDTIEKLAHQQLQAGHAVLFLGPAGVGKTETAQRIADNLGVKLYILNASQFSKEDLVIPARDDDGKTIQVLTHPLDNTLVLIDEITNANPALMGALLSLILEHRIGSRKFENMYIIATGNRDNESVLATPLPRPLMERFAVYNFPVVPVDDWVNFMLDHYADQVHPYYLNFLTKTGNVGNIFFAQEHEGEVSDYVQRPSPRSHSRVSRLLRRFYPTKDSILNHIEDVTEQIRALAGPDVAAAFMGFIQDEKNHLSLEDFRNGRRPENATQYMHLILDAAAQMRPDKTITATDKKAIEEYSAKVVEDMNAILGAGMHSPDLRRLAALAPRYIIGYTDPKDDVEAATATLLVRRLYMMSKERIGSEAPFVQIMNARAARFNKTNGMSANNGTQE